MRCPVCAVEVGRAQIICDNCGILLMDERYRQDMEAQESAGRQRRSTLRKLPGDPSSQDTSPAESMTPEDSLKDQLKGQLEAHLQGTPPPPVASPASREEFPPDASMDLPPTDMSDIPSSPPPDPGEPVVTYGEPEPGAATADAPPPAKAKGGFPPILTNFYFLAVMTLFIPLIPLFFAFKSDWDKRKKIVFALVHLFYWGLSFLLTLLIVMAAIGSAASTPGVM